MDITISRETFKEKREKIRLKFSGAKFFINIIKDFLHMKKVINFKKAWKFNIPGYDFEDLVQHGYLSVIKAINKYKLGSNSYNSYFLKSIDTNFCALLRGEIKHFRGVTRC